MTITASMSVFNEESRIEATLRSLMWCDEIVILDKESTDRTCEIARKYTDKIITTPHREFRSDELRIAFENITSEWVLATTASDLVHPELATQIRELTQRADFPYDVIHVPFRRYVLGLETARSPWHSALNPVVFRKSIAKINDNNVHAALVFDSRRHYKMSRSSRACMYHLTHATADIMMERHMRYWHADARAQLSDLSLRAALMVVLKSFFIVVFRRRTWLMGWDGMALSFAYLSYSMMRFVYIWEKRRSKTPQTYQNIRESILQAWKKAEGKKDV